MDGQAVSPFNLSKLFRLLVAYWFRIPYQDLLSQNNSCNWLLWCLARVGGFNQSASPNTVRLCRSSCSGQGPQGEGEGRSRREGHPWCWESHP